MKPDGIWLSYNEEWIEWCEGADFYTHDIERLINKNLDIYFKYVWITAYDCSCCCIWNVAQIKLVSEIYKKKQN